MGARRVRNKKQGTGFGKDRFHFSEKAFIDCVQLGPRLQIPVVRPNPAPSDGICDGSHMFQEFWRRPGGFAFPKGREGAIVADVSTVYSGMGGNLPRLGQTCLGILEKLAGPRSRRLLYSVMMLCL